MTMTRMRAQAKLVDNLFPNSRARNNEILIFLTESSGVMHYVAMCSLDFTILISIQNTRSI
jgi:hypothetical protein